MSVTASSGEGETIGQLVERAQAVAPNSLHAHGYQITYLGQWQLDQPPTGHYDEPNNPRWTEEDA